MGLFSWKKQPQPSPYPQGNVEQRPSPSLPPSGRHDGNGQHGPAPNLSPSPFRPAGYLPPPPPPPPYGWNHSRPVGPAPSAPCHNQDQRHYAPIIVNQHYYLAPPHPPHLPPSNVYPNSGGGSALSKLKLGSTSDLIQLPANVVNQFVDDGLPQWHAYGTQLLNQGAALYDQISTKFDDVMTMIDRDKFTGNENDLFMYQQPGQAPPLPPADATHHSAVSKGDLGKKSKKGAPKNQISAVATSPIIGGYFAKVDLYTNSKLPLNLPSFQVHVPTYPLLCLAARYAERVYEKPQGAERDAHVQADWKTGTKAMYIKSVPMDHMGTIVFAIRGTASFMDWAVNLNTAPTAPTGFLDDVRNFCHAGFLSVARKMIAPVASRLRQLLEEDPGRCASSLLITGHSAGGAIASLLYMHMLATSNAASSELNLLTGCFKRIHCITFGSPPVSLFPLQTPHRHELRKSLFYSFINEGDPVTRADKAYVKSLLELFAAPAPTTVKNKDSTKLLTPPANTPPKPSKPQGKKSKSSLASKASKVSMKSNQSLLSISSTKTNKSKPPGPVWRVPPSTLSNAGRIVVLRSGNPHAKFKRTKTVEERLNEGVIAQVASDEKLRSVIWGDPVCHVMKLYAARIEVLAVAAVTVKGH
ncbi:alpha/beta-hydrolase [Xylariaceae sp. AK1471]|nr:alpha/beta-hydrolase [Xylariaceae sp. AK1471]